ncbi:hypothetical protein INS49_012695 [Diaporthe citri]|uniref:uncharacterized protein n=1 Tax=Diaporthe citri TaxID=83186 RepID=UPI001C7FCD90|nr:uncharacterized protein INS49_012695 [Diaporthe citri]KAG6359175.1 hypothetical protein INS49_012695 [Diaporthe citri]
MGINSDMPSSNGSNQPDKIDVEALSNKYLEEKERRQRQQALEDGQQVQVIILGAGFGGILFAARLVEAGIKPEDIRIVDVAGGFGGTWYWNRYPGVMCDTEASVYLPLLEETGYIPTHKYSYGEDIRGHCERIAKTLWLRG